jgi:Big-like domain-containing protein/K319-like protein/HYR domain-containing protein
LNLIEYSKIHFSYKIGKILIVVLASISFLVSNGFIQQGASAHEYFSLVSSSAPSNQATDDITPPINIKVPSNKLVEATGKNGASVSYSVSATDASGKKITVDCNPASGTIFPIGTSEVLCNADGSSTTKSFSITVRDTTPPTVFVPSDLILEATGPLGRTVNFNSNATDVVDGPLSVTCDPPSGSTFPLGQTKVQCNATDSAGNRGTNDFIITVRDTTPPETTLGNVSVGWLGGIKIDESTPSNDINFDFNGTDLVGIERYECKFDDGSWQISKSEINASGIEINICTYTSISTDGIHNFLVRAVDTSGNKDQSPPKFTWEIETPLKSVQDLIPQLSTNKSTADMVSQLDEVVKTLSDSAEENDAKACYQLNSFINSIKINIMTGVSVYSDFDWIFRSTLAIMDNLGCPPPIADAGISQSIDAGTANVILDGSGSLYTSDDVSFKWEQVTGTPKVNIKNANSEKASFNAPSTSAITGSDASTTLSFQLTVTENRGLQSTDITTVEIYTENTPPVAKSQSVTTTSDTPASITLDASDKDGDTLTYAIESFPTHGSLSSLDKDSGSVTYTPDRSYTGSDSFTFTASDDTSTSNTAKVSITVNSVTPVNTPPVVTQQNVSTRTNSPLNVTLAASDADDDTLQHSIISQPENGTLGKINQTTHTVTYTPNPDFTGSDSFTHTVNDGKTNSETGKVNINVRKK